MRGWIEFLAARPWLWVVVAFVILIFAWATLLTLASRNAPQAIEVKRAIPAPP